MDHIVVIMVRTIEVLGASTHCSRGVRLRLEHHMRAYTTDIQVFVHVRIMCFNHVLVNVFFHFRGTSESKSNSVIIDLSPDMKRVKALLSSFTLLPNINNSLCRPTRVKAGSL
jgi:hypothetical protein